MRPDQTQLLAALERKRKLPPGSVSDPYSLQSLTSRLDPSSLEVADPESKPEEAAPTGPGMLSATPSEGFEGLKGVGSYTPPESFQVAPDAPQSPVAPSPAPLQVASSQNTGQGS